LYCISSNKVFFKNLTELIRGPDDKNRAKVPYSAAPSSTASTTNIIRLTLISNVLYYIILCTVQYYVDEIYVILF
jgi:hypothetical protein